MSSKVVVLPTNILYGGEVETNELDNYKSFGEFLLKCLRRNGETVCLIDATINENLKSNQLFDLSVQCAFGLQKLKVRTGDVIGICCENRLEFIATALGIWLANCTIAPFNLAYTERELDHAFKLTRPKIIFTSPVGLKKINSLNESNSFIQTIITYGSVENLNKNVLLWKDFLVSPNFGQEFIPKPYDNEQTALILCSSGTTGLPKAVEITLRNVRAIIGPAIQKLETLPSNTSISIVPFSHAYGFFVNLQHSLIKNAQLVYLQKYSDREYLQAVQNYKINILYVVPSMMVMLAKNPIALEYDLSSVFAIRCGTAALSADTIKSVQDRFGPKIMIRQGYGLTEATARLVLQVNLSKIGSVGQVCEGVYAKFIDENGNAVGPNQRGEMCFKGPTVMKGYLGDEKATSETIDRDGWLHTGDVGYYDEDFDIYVVDRIKELIKYKGAQVAPAELEALLLTHPKIKDVGVTALPDEEAGELPTAFVVKRDGAQLTEKEVIEFVAARVSSPKRLRGGVWFVEEIPKNPTGKILRRVLKTMLLKNSSKSKL